MYYIRYIWHISSTDWVCLDVVAVNVPSHQGHVEDACAASALLVPAPGVTCGAAVTQYSSANDGVDAVLEILCNTECPQGHLA